tara:strand:- start:333 stop:608 length:276 start_codon:yes stop_codon:yes gene_type:complete
MLDLYHPIKNEFLPYDAEQVAWLSDPNNMIKFYKGGSMFMLKKIPNKDVLYIYGQQYLPTLHEEDVPEIEAEELDDALGIQFTPVDPDDLD